MNSHSYPHAIDTLRRIRESAGEAEVTGLQDEELRPFVENDTLLSICIDEAWQTFQALSDEEKNYIQQPEQELRQGLQEGLLNFYSPNSINPYIPLAARGPWVVTSHGAVVWDCGGYGMLGLGHAPQAVIDSMQKPVVMANVMTASFSQRRFIDRLRQALGFTRSDGCPFDQFLCLNSGSESMTVASRIADANALVRTSKGGPNEGWEIKFLALQGAFHGRTDRPAQVSHSCLNKYNKHLASFKDRTNLILVPPNDCEALEKIFTQATKDKVFIEAMFLEPVQGEGNPGSAVDVAFYNLARKLTLEHGSMLIADSIQAGLRGHGCLSIIDYPGFQDSAAPDMETWSKALNAGQYPLSVLGLTSRAAACYRQGLYGNTMTTNPRALDVACVVMDQITNELRANIAERGEQFVSELLKLNDEFPNIGRGVQGTGLLFCMEISEHLPVVDTVERICRKRGLGIIHGGKNALRFTPHFAVKDAEVKLVIDILREVFSSLSE